MRYSCAWSRDTLTVLRAVRGLHFGGRLITNRSLCNTSSTAWRSAIAPERARRGRRVGSASTTGRAVDADRGSRIARGRHSDRGPRRPSMVTDSMANHQSGSSVSRGFRGIPRMSATFFWMMIVSARVAASAAADVLGFEMFHAREPASAWTSSPRPRMSCKAPCSRCRRQLVEQGRVHRLATQQGAQLWHGLLARRRLAVRCEADDSRDIATLGLRGTSI